MSGLVCKKCGVVIQTNCEQRLGYASQLACHNCGWVAMRTLAVWKLRTWERAVWKFTYGTRVFEYAFNFLFKRQAARLT